MFEVRPDITSVKVGKEQIVAIIESINTPMVAAANKPLEPAKAIIMGVRNQTGLFSIFIYLHLKQSHESLIYLHEPPEVPMESYHETEVEALQFVESMGFMVDNLNFRKLTPEQQDSLMEGMPIFQDDLAAFSRRHEPMSEGEDGPEDGDVDLGPLTNDVIELKDVAEVVDGQIIAQEPLVSAEGLAKIIRLFSSF